MKEIDLSECKKIPRYSNYFINKQGDVFSTRNRENLKIKVLKLKTHQMKYGLPYVSVISDSGNITTKRPKLLLKELFGENNV